MPDWVNILQSRMSFEVAVWIVTWAAVTMLALIAGNLHARVRALETAAATGQTRVAYRYLVGRRLPALASDTDRLRLCLLLSTDCDACRSLVEQIELVSWQTPTLIAWTDDAERRPRVPDGVAILPKGKALAEDLGVRVTPFACLIGPDGEVKQAAPTGSIQALIQFTESAQQPLTAGATIA